MASKKKQARKAIIDMIQNGIEARADNSRFEDKADELEDEIDQAFTEIVMMWKK